MQHFVSVLRKYQEYLIRMFFFNWKLSVTIKMLIDTNVNKITNKEMWSTQSSDEKLDH